MYMDMEEFIDPYMAASPAANEPDILRNVLDTAKTLAVQEYTGTRHPRPDIPLMRLVVDEATQQEAPDFTLPEQVVRDYGGLMPQQLRNVRFTNVFGDSPYEYLSNVRDGSGDRKFTFRTLLNEDTDELVKRATYPRGRPGTLLGRQNPVVTFGYKCDAESIQRGRQCDLPFNAWYKEDQRGIDTLNRDIPGIVQDIFDTSSQGYTNPQPVVVEDATGARENPMIGTAGVIRRRIAPSLTDIRASIKQNVNRMRAEGQPQYRNLSA